jgi:hypothetical protein
MVVKSFFVDLQSERESRSKGFSLQAVKEICCEDHDFMQPAFCVYVRRMGEVEEDRLTDPLA